MTSVKDQILNALTWFKAKLETGCVNNCVSTITTAPLAASQGKVLQDQINTLNTSIANARTEATNKANTAQTNAINTARSKANTAFNSYLSVQRVTGANITVAAGGAFTVSAPVAKAGYTAIGAVGHGMGGTASTFAMIREVKVASNTAWIYGRNDYSKQVTWTPTWDILYAKNSPVA